MATRPHGRGGEGRFLKMTAVPLLSLTGILFLLGQHNPPPSSESSLRTLLQESLALRDVGACAPALPLLREVISRAPPGEEEAQARFALGECLERLGEGMEALHVWEELLEQPEGESWVPHALFRLGRLYLLTDSPKEGRAALLALTRLPLTPLDLAVARAFLAYGETQGGRSLRALKLLEQAVPILNEAPEGEVSAREGRAVAALAGGELLAREASRISFTTSSPKAQRKRLERRTSLLIQAQDAYARAASAGDPRWGCAALYRMGRAYESLYTDLLRTASPRSLDREQVEVFQASLNARTLPVLRRTMDHYQGAWDLAIRTAFPNHWADLARERLTALEDVLATSLSGFPEASP